MDQVLKPIVDGIADLVSIQLPGSLLVISIGAIIYLYRTNKQEIRELNQRINEEIKNGIALAEGFRKSYEDDADRRNELYERLLDEDRRRDR